MILYVLFNSSIQFTISHYNQMCCGKLNLATSWTLKRKLAIKLSLIGNILEKMVHNHLAPLCIRYVSAILSSQWCTKTIVQNAYEHVWWHVLVPPGESIFKTPILWLTQMLKLYPTSFPLRALVHSTFPCKHVTKQWQPQGHILR